MWYGLTKENFVDTLLVFMAVGVLAAVLGLGSAIYHHAPIGNYWAVVALLFAIPSTWLILGAVLSTTWLRVGSNSIEWYVWKKFLIRTYPIATLVSIGTGSFSAVHIHTHRGTIRLLGLHHTDRVELTKHLLALKPDIKFLST
jgi:hypothetical protein